MLGRHLKSALALVLLDEYPSAFVVLRAALEHHQLDRLLFLATRYRQSYKVAPAKVAAEHRRLQNLQAGTRPDILRWKEKKGRFVVTVAGLFETGRLLKPPQLSPYYFAIERYDPFTGVPRIQAKLSRTFMPLKLHRLAAQETKRLWDGGFSPKAVRANLLLNRLITHHQALQIDVHYGFLSAYAHPAAAGYNLAFGRNQPRGRSGYDHFASELALLYVLVLACEELSIFRRALNRRPTQRLRGWDEVERLIARSRAASDHFWFLQGEPHIFDRIVEANDRAARGGGKSLSVPDPRTIPSDKVHYYRNPLVRLVELHRSHREWSTGLVFASPFPRTDAVNRI